MNDTGTNTGTIAAGSGEFGHAVSIDNQTMAVSSFQGVPPLGLATQLRVFIDPDLLQYGVVWAAAGTWNDVFAIEPGALQRATNGVVSDIKRQ